MPESVRIPILVRPVVPLAISPWSTGTNVAPVYTFIRDAIFIEPEVPGRYFKRRIGLFVSLTVCNTGTGTCTCHGCPDNSCQTHR